MCVLNGDWCCMALHSFSTPQLLWLAAVTRSSLHVWQGANHEADLQEGRRTLGLKPAGWMLGPGHVCSWVAQEPKIKTFRKKPRFHDHHAQSQSVH